MIKKISFAFFLSFCLIGLGMFWHQLSAGFRLQKIAFSIPENTEWETFLPEKEKGEVRKILQQKFTYLDKGRQSYVFLSEDGKYVLKLFRYHLVRKRFSLYIPYFLKFWDKDAGRKLFAKKGQFENWMESYKLAFEKLKEETGLIYLHLVKTSFLDQKIEVLDKLGRSYFLPLDSTGFLLQKKADLFSNVVGDLIRKKDRTNLKKVFKAYFATVASRHQKGIANKDHSWIKNYGIIGFNEAVEIDVGRYSEVSPAKKEEDLALDLYLYSTPFRKYLSKAFPECLSDYKEAIEEESIKWFERAEKNL